MRADKVHYYSKRAAAEMIDYFKPKELMDYQDTSLIVEELAKSCTTRRAGNIVWTPNPRMFPGLPVGSWPLTSIMIMGLHC